MEENINQTEEVSEVNNEPAPPAKNSLLKEVLSYVKIVVIAFLIAYFITHVLIINCIVPTGSMQSTIELNDRIIGSRLSYIASNPQRGDIIVFKYPGDSSGKTTYIKRVVGLPGETIEIKDNRIYINGSETPLDEPYLNEQYMVGGSKANCGPFTIPEDCYFCMGDHRNNSLDSRYWGTVKKSEIYGKALFTYFPFGNAKWLNVDYNY